MSSIELGMVVTDRVTKVQGIVVGRTEWLTGCATVGIQRPVDNEGKVPEVFWADETRLEEYLGDGRLEETDGGFSLPAGRAPQLVAGGPQPTPQRSDSR